MSTERQPEGTSEFVTRIPVGTVRVRELSILTTELHVQSGRHCAQCRRIYTQQLALVNSSLGAPDRTSRWSQYYQSYVHWHTDFVLGF